MSATHLSPDFAVAPQIQPSDMAALAAQGVRSVICNRPDHEDEGQPTYAEIAAAARAAGMAVRHIPVVPGQMTQGDIAAFGTALDELPKPILAYCRSGNRAAMLFAAQVPTAPLGA